MSDPIVKGAKRSASRPISRQTSAASSSRTRRVEAKSARPVPLVKKTGAEKAPVRKAAPVDKAAASTKGRPAKKPVKAPASREKASARGATKRTEGRSVTSRPENGKSEKGKQPVTAAPQRARSRPGPPPVSTAKTGPAVVPANRQPPLSEAAALRDFERAHKEFARGHFAEARSLFRAIVEKHLGVSEVAARARTYLAITEARLRVETVLPRDADSLYDRGVIELNRGEYVAAQEMFERALKRESGAAHIHYGLAAARARLGAIDAALDSLRRALELQPTLRVRAQRDQDLTTLRNEPDFERLIFGPH